LEWEAEALEEVWAEVGEFKMKIAIATDSGRVSEHFGRCPEFTIVEIEEGRVIKKEVIANPGHAIGFLPKFFHEMGVDCVIAGGAGWRAKELFDEFKVELIMGIVGTVDEVIQKYLDNKIVPGDSTCTLQAGKGYGIEKEDYHD